MKRTELTSITGSEGPAQQKAEDAMPDAAAPSLSPAVQKHIGNLLKASYQNLLAEAVPDRFVNLLEQLEQSEGKGK